MCSVCGNRITNNIPSVKCIQCSNWCHLKHCTTLKSHREWTEDFIADCCRKQQGQRTVWICTVCNMPIYKNIISVQCEGWCHMRRCSGLVNHKARTANFIAPCCSQAAQICQNYNTSPPSTLGATSVTPTGIYDVRVPPTTVSVNISQPTSNISSILSTIVHQHLPTYIHLPYPLTSYN